MIPIVAGLMMGAALGGGIAALQKKDVLQGALMGGIGGALGGAFMPAAAAGAAPVAGAVEGAAASGFGATGIAGGSAGAGVLPAAQSSILAGAPGAAGGAFPLSSSAFPLTSNVASSAFPLSSSAFPLTSSVAGGATGGAGSGGMFSGGIGNFLSQNKYALAGGVLGGMMAPGEEPDKADQGNIRDYTFNREVNPLYGQPGQPYFIDKYTAGDVTPVEDYNKAGGGIIALADGGKPQDYSVVRPVNPAVQAYNQQLMERANQQYNINPRPAAMQVPGSAGYGAYVPLPTSALTKPADAGIGGLRFDPVTGRYVGTFEAPGSKKSDFEKMREELDSLKSEQSRYNDTGGAANGGLMQSYAMGGDIGASYPSPDDGGVLDKSSMVGAHQTVNMAPHYPMQGRYQGYAGGGHLGDYSDGGRLLKGPGDGVSDDIPAQIGRRQPARLADGEFVVPARIVSELGNGSTDAGAKRLYAMMDRVQSNRRKSVGKGKVAVDSKAYRNLPA
jgi:hypothetical protein